MNPNVRTILKTHDAQAKAKKAKKAAQTRAAMRYRGIINLDFTNPADGEYQRLIVSLIEQGWRYIETSALYIEGDLPVILCSFEILAKQCQDAGILSAMTLHIQGSENLDGTKYKATEQYKGALERVKAKEWPKSS